MVDMTSESCFDFDSLVSPTISASTCPHTERKAILSKQISEQLGEKGVECKVCGKWFQMRW